MALLIRFRGGAAGVGGILAVRSRSATAFDFWTRCDSDDDSGDDDGGDKDIPGCDDAEDGVDVTSRGKRFSSTAVVASENDCNCSGL